ncbi:MAG: hypothetical protein MUF00_21445 [Gemmatimonadaceae bacterium]|jgi:hypothetical protein|nr:hypothetical protein [Gemmatimonadaceae bacterium]
MPPLPSHDPSRDLAATVLRVLEQWRTVATYAERGAMVLWSPRLSELTDRASRLRLLVRRVRAPKLAGHLRAELVRVERDRVTAALGLIDDMLDADALLLVSASPPDSR